MDSDEEEKDHEPKEKEKEREKDQGPEKDQSVLLPTEVSTEVLEDGWTRVGTLLVSDKVLGYGSHGTIVFLGKFEGRNVAVKRLLAQYYDLAEREITLLQQSDYHRNIIRYYCRERQGDFLYIALELCVASLHDWLDPFNEEAMETEIELKKMAVFETLDEKRVLIEIIVGLHHLHELQIVHRDLKPQNILISVHKTVLISDFGLCKKLDEGHASYNTSVPGTVGWSAPEAIKRRKNFTLNGGNSDSNSSSGNEGSNTNTNHRLTKAVDIFSLGCMMYYILTKGKHPFGEKIEREVNIVKNHYNLSHLSHSIEAQHLIQRMISQNPDERPTTREVLAHPFFWDEKKKLNFLQEASDVFECEDKAAQIILDLESEASKILGDSWCKRVDKLFIDNLGKFRKYQENSVRDLLRVIRNKKNHFQDLPQDVKILLGPLPTGFFNYFNDRFPYLLMHVYQIISSPSYLHRNSPNFAIFFEYASV